MLIIWWCVLSDFVFMQIFSFCFLNVKLAEYILKFPLYLLLQRWNTVPLLFEMLLMKSWLSFWFYFSHIMWLTSLTTFKVLSSLWFSWFIFFLCWLLVLEMFCCKVFRPNSRETVLELLELLFIHMCWSVLHQRLKSNHVDIQEISLVFCVELVPWIFPWLQLCSPNSRKHLNVHKFLSYHWRCPEDSSRP